MLSTKVSCVGMMSAAVGLDRSRVGERLQAALAGLQELHLLRDRQGDMVSWALRVNREEPVTRPRAGPEDARMIGAEEQRLEATLTALKQQLSRLRKQDVGLKTHLQQLDQQISDLKLDVSKASTEQLESDSRPSSGFYDLSDGGSCSLSNSCTSVYSECLSSSQTSLLLPPTSPANSQVAPALHADVYRRCSTDEGATHPNPTRATGLHLGSSRIRASSTVTELGRPRPVSTGDLDRMMILGLNYKPVDAKKPPMCSNPKMPTMEPKFQSNLLSHSGFELYHHPSSLHAVALQSPIFFNSGESAIPEFIDGEKPPVSDSDVLNDGTEIDCDSKTLGYIDKLLQRSYNKTHIEMAPEATQIQSNYQRKPPEVVTVFPQKPVSLSQPPPTQATNIIPLDNKQRRHCMTHSCPETTDNTDHHHGVRPQEVSYGFSYPAVVREYSSDEVTSSTLRKKNKIHVGFVSRGHTEKVSGDSLPTRQIEKKGHIQRPVMSRGSSADDVHVFEVQNGHTGSPQFVHAKFVPGGTQRVKVRQFDRKTKAVKLRRRSSEKPRALRQQHSYSSGEPTRESSGSKGEPRRPGKGKVIQKNSCCPSEERKHGSGSDSSHCGPTIIYTHKVQKKPHPAPAATKFSKSRRFQCGEYENLADQRKKRQGAARLVSDGERFPALCAQQQISKDFYGQAPGSMHLDRSMSTKAGHWIGPHCPSISSNSFNAKLNARYPPAPYHISRLYPPQCESEYSAECMSIFHSTIATSSDGETSDNTTNRFGDSESSQSFQSFSDSDSSLSMEEGNHQDSLEEEGDLVWAEASLGPTAAGKTLQQLPRPEASACRIKASRALKKKIRRFQPASLKVMTLV
ncbi:dapper homolog 2 [Syngnathoides biaculeatus]|uniref:dapper homolog 2 n=1 Tax=Syngnathoides biaculeatus TaxID=300417 RepID=UPI002ADE1965|nr:dapper homolog 2 [Syngnathoides biaculeatus]